MAWDVTVALEDRPGALASLGEATGTANLNLDGVVGVTAGGVGVIHLLVEDPDRTTEVLTNAGLAVLGRREVLVTQVEDRPGELGRIARRLADAGVNIDLLYLGTGTRLVIGVDDLAKARAAL
jgi:hypothetical protein